MQCKFAEWDWGKLQKARAIPGFQPLRIAGFLALNHLYLSL